MSFSFDPHQGLIIVQAELEGPLGSAVLRLALDTGATSTLINAAMLVSLGYDPGLARNRVQVTTGSGVEFAPQITLSKIRLWAKSAPAFLSFVTLCRQAQALMGYSAWTSFAGND